MQKKRGWILDQMTRIIFQPKKLTNTIKSAFNLWGLNDNHGYDYKPIPKQKDNNRYRVLDFFMKNLHSFFIFQFLQLKCSCFLMLFLNI